MILKEQKFTIPAFAFFILLVSACGSLRPKEFYEPRGWRLALKNNEVRSTSSGREAGFSKEKSSTDQKLSGDYYYGIASWYGDQFHGKKTANGEVYDKRALTAAHKYLALNTIISVENSENGKKVVLRINDRGPYVDNRVLDLTEKAAEELGYRHEGLAKVRFKILKLPKGAKSHGNFKAYRQHVVQLAAFKDKKYANRYREKLTRRFSKVPLRLQEIDSRVYHVIIGPYNDKRKARQVAYQLKKEGIDNLVRTYMK